MREEGGGVSDRDEKEWERDGIVWVGEIGLGLGLGFLRWWDLIRAWKVSARVASSAESAATAAAEEKKEEEKG